MLCESSLWRMALCSDSDHVDPAAPCPAGSPKSPPLTSSPSAQKMLPPVRSSPKKHSSSFSEETQSQQGGVFSQSSSPLDWRRLSPGVGIPGRGESSGAEAFLVPSSCHSICQHYSDLHIAGGQVLPLSPSAGDPEGSDLQDLHHGPFLLSRDVPPPSLLPPPQVPEPRTTRWREGSGRERPSLLQDGRPLSNSQLNSYLEQKLLELYKEYLTEGPAGPRPLMASEILQSSLSQITLQLSREQKLETTRAKDMLLSFLLRATSSSQSSQISTPQLQISSQTK
ncbi:TLR adapter interacting with SLC15A4 on the lysosome [Salminus brasiliensis]|uniref:TLR adapter interacting with SLC15A4 on the lysosome n=1 Tax=Salminus brasiliensis TaxID=930266 RepID=UPI003B82DFB0